MKTFFLTTFVICMFVSAYFIMGFITTDDHHYYRYYKPPESVEIVHELLNEAEDFLTHKYHLDCMGTSVAMPEGIVGQLGLQFSINKILTREELRKILVNTGRDLMCMINANTKIRPHLKKYPFTIEDVEITIFLSDPAGYKLSHPHISNAAINMGKLDYVTYIRGGEEILSEASEFKESYEDALKALNKPSLECKDESHG